VRWSTSGPGLRPPPIKKNKVLIKFLSDDRKALNLLIYNFKGRTNKLLFLILLFYNLRPFSRVRFTDGSVVDLQSL
jgi:hypothetical protein